MVGEETEAHGWSGSDPGTVFPAAALVTGQAGVCGKTRPSVPCPQLCCECWVEERLGGLPGRLHNLSCLLRELLAFSALRTRQESCKIRGQGSWEPPHGEELRGGLLQPD